MTTQTKPLIIYVDDEPRNLTVFEANMPPEWDVRCFDNAVEALKTIKSLNPAVIVSDQRMPQMTGLEFLEVAAQLLPDAVRVIVTGQTEEQTIIQLIRRAKIFDYITKPWDPEMLTKQLENALEFHNNITEKKRILELLNQQNKELEKRNNELKAITLELQESRQREVEMQNEISSWVPAPLVAAIKEKTTTFPVTKDIVGITYDIINSSAYSGTLVKDQTVRSHILKMFVHCLVRHGGIRESSAGDSAYGHFGAVAAHENPHVAAMAAAQEFRVALRSFAKLNNIPVECGIAIHHAPNTLIQVHEVRVESSAGHVIQKSFDTDSSHVDLLHRIEKLVHELPGSNIIMSADFIKHLPDASPKIVGLGTVPIRGQSKPVELYMLASDAVSNELLEAFRARLSTPIKLVA